MSFTTGGDGWPATINWETCAWTRVEGETALLLSARTTTSRSGTLTFNSRMFEETQGFLGLSKLSHRGRLRSQESVATIVLTSAGVVLVRSGGAVAAFGPESLPSARVADHVPLLLVVRDLDGHRSLAASIRACAADGFAAGARARVLDLRAELERPAALGTFSSAGGGTVTWPEVSSTVIIDQNFLIHLDRCLSGSTAADWGHLRDAVAWLAACDSVPGFAIAECSYGAHGLDRAAELRAAVETWWAIAHQETTVEHARCLYRQTVEEQRARSTPPEDDRSFLIDLSYLGVLVVATLWQDLRGRPFDRRERIASWRSWLAVMNQEGVGVPGYCGAAVRHLLLRTDVEHVDAAKMLKLTKAPTRRDLLGAAWDLLYLTISDFARGGELEGTGDRPVLFLTADKPAAAAARSSFLIGVVTGSDVTLGLLAIDDVVSEKFSTAEREELAEVQRLLIGDQERRARDPHIDLPLVRRLIDDAARSVSWRTAD